jgi:hypothetical protein
MGLVNAYSTYHIYSAEAGQNDMEWAHSTYLRHSGIPEELPRDICNVAPMAKRVGQGQSRATGDTLRPRSPSIKSLFELLVKMLGIALTPDMANTENSSEGKMNPKRPKRSEENEERFELK